MVRRLPDHVRGVEEQAGIHRRPGDRHGAHVAPEPGGTRRLVRADLGGLPRLPVVERDIGARAAEHQVGIAGIGRRDAVFLDVGRMPVVEGDTSVHGAAVHARRARVLLAAAHPIGEAVVGSDVVHRRGGLGVPVAPRLTAIGRDDRALVRHGEDDVGVLGVDPDPLIIVSARRAPHGGPGEPAVLGPPHHHARAIDDIGVLRVHRDGGEIAPADAGERPGVLDRSLRVRRGVGTAHREVPMLATIGGFVETHRSRSTGRVRGGCHGVEDLRVARRDRDVGLQQRRQPLGELLPGGPSVGGLEDPVAAAAEPASLVECLLLLPEGRVDGGRIRGVDADVVAAGVLVLI